MPPILGVTQEAIEGRLQKLVKKHKKELIRVDGGEVLTSNYLNSICEEVNEDLQQRQ